MECFIHAPLLLVGATAGYLFVYDLVRARMSFGAMPGLVGV